MPLFKRSAAELFGTFWLVFAGCGSAVIAAAYPNLGIGFFGVAFAFGLTVLTMAFAIGHVSGCHLNPAVSIGLVVAKRFPASELISYIASFPDVWFATHLEVAEEWRASQVQAGTWDEAALTPELPGS